ncbi:MAG: Spy/CpxP family protein refolding chaperone [Nannocystaceae bacterium]|nr:Spy/CpxP family protein refolding chaperone [Nannocystaceae bacterium]
MNAIISTALLSLFTVFAAPTDGPDTRADTARKGHHGRGGMCAKIDCSDDQKTQLKAIRAAFKAETADDRADAKDLRARYKAEKSADNPDAERMAALRKEMKTLRVSIKEARAESKTEAKAVLTPEQRELLVALRAERKAERGNRSKGERRGSKGKRGKKGKKGKHGSKGKHGKHGSKGKHGKQAKRSATAPTNG